MLWLGFEVLDVRVKPADAATYTLDNVVLHDRLTATDDSNVVQWYLMRSAVPGVTGELQDPEWTTHPDYITFLGKSGQTWDGFVVRVSDKQLLKFNEDKMFETSTPHVWIGDSTAAPAPSGRGRQADGWLPRDSIYAYFGTTNVRIVYTIRIGTAQDLYYVDYTCDTCDSVVPVRVTKPADRESYRTESGLISPDGQYIVYNCFTGDPADVNTLYESYAQPLTPNGVAQLVASPAADPHWWFYNGRTYVVYSTQGGFNTHDLAVIAEGADGYTVRQEVSLSPQGPLYIQFALLGDPVSFLPYPFKGGVSPDGFHAGTGYSRAYIYRFF
jgi:hypothetical protein